jgi:competence protein ComEA
LESTVDRRWIIVLAVAVAAAGAGIWFGRGVTQTAPGVETLGRSPVPTPATETTGAATMVVHVAGWVETPGLVRLPVGARVGDAVAAAGGIRPGARLTDLNLAQPLTDGEQVAVPAPGSSTPLPGDAGGGEEDDGLVRLNSATAEELERLPGVGPVLAERIVGHREDMGPFERVEDLLEVPGIGEAKLASIRDLVVVP